MKGISNSMSRRKFCTSSSAIATQLLLSGFGIPSPSYRQNEWRFPFRELSSCDDTGIDERYDKKCYVRDITELGIAKTWERICKWVLINGEEENPFLDISNFGELYEEGLAINNKDEKKSSGQYYTPHDVSRIMAKWFSRLKGRKICDVACGVGNLTLAFLDHIGRKEAQEILSKGLLYLYDIDEVAVTICVTSILVRYGHEYADKIHVICGDFLAAGLTLPHDSKVISNPPYAAVNVMPSSWEITETVESTKELYAAFMEKIITQSKASVIITPYSFIGGSKFYPLRRILNNYNGFVISFDNVPGAIFNGRKHGIFNSNMGNSVRAAITVVENDMNGKGFRFSPLIRFKSAERSALLTCERLMTFVGKKRQLVSTTQTMYAKCDRRLEHIFERWNMKGTTSIAEHLDPCGAYLLNMPNTCRYFTVAVDHALSRKGQLVLRFADADAYWYVMCMVNSSFAYWFWRLYDGGITYPSGLFLKMPLFFNSLTGADRAFCRQVGQEMVSKAKNYIITKANVGVQENVKFPREYRDRINRRFLDILDILDDERIFDIVHSNMALEINI